MPLRIAAKLPRGERRYFKERLEPQIDGTQIRLIGEVNDEAKQPFLAGAAALLFPIDWPEPFGLVMIEAMACGTPVIAFRSGSVPEVIDEGVTGFVVDDEHGRLDLPGLSDVVRQFPTPPSSRYPTINVCPWPGRIGAVRSSAARLAAIPAGESPANRGVQTLL